MNFTKEPGEGALLVHKMSLLSSHTWRTRDAQNATNRSAGNGSVWKSLHIKMGSLSIKKTEGIFLEVNMRKCGLFPDLLLTCLTATEMGEPATGQELPSWILFRSSAALVQNFDVSRSTDILYTTPISGIKPHWSLI